MSQAICKAEGRISETAIDDEIVVMSLDSGDFFSLTGTGRAIWQLIDGQRDRQALIGAVAAEYATDRAAIAEDVGDFLAEMRLAGLIAGE